VTAMISKKVGKIDIIAGGGEEGLFFDKKKVREVMVNHRESAEGGALIEKGVARRARGGFGLKKRFSGHLTTARAAT